MTFSKFTNPIQLTLTAIAAMLVVACGDNSKPEPAPGSPGDDSATEVRPPSEGTSIGPGSSPTALATEIEPSSERGQAISRAMRIRDSEERKAEIAKLSVEWINEDLNGYLEYIDELEESDDAGERAWEMLAPALATALPDVNEQAASDEMFVELVERFVDELAYQSPRDALNWSREWLLDETLESSLSVIAPEIALEDPDEAMKILTELKDPDYRLDAIAGISYSIGDVRPEQALSWAASFEDPGERVEAISGVLSVMAEKGPEKAAQEFTSAFQNLATLAAQDPLAMGSLSAAASSIAAEWAYQNPVQAMAWVNTLPEGDLREEAVESVFMEWAEIAPDDALTSYLARTEKSEFLPEIIFESWAYETPQDAAVAITKLTDPADRNNAIQGLVRGWMDSEDEPQAVVDWVSTLNAGIERDTAMRSVVEELTYSYPELAWEQAQTIQDTQQRSAALQEAFLSLAEDDVEVARQALNNAQLTPAQRDQLQKLIDEN